MKLSTSVQVLNQQIMAALKPVAIANGYYNELMNALDDVAFRVTEVRELCGEIALYHYENHAPGPLNLCEDICRLADKL